MIIRQADVVMAFLKGEPEGLGKPVGALSYGMELWVHGIKVAEWRGDKVVVVVNVSGVTTHRRSIIKVLSLMKTMADPGVVEVRQPQKEW